MLGSSDDGDSVVFDDVAFESEEKEIRSQGRVGKVKEKERSLPIPNPSGATGPNPNSRRAGFPQLPEIEKRRVVRLMSRRERNQERKTHSCSRCL